MKKPEMPKGEIDRVAALCNLNILDTPQEERFDRLTRVAQKHFDVPIALVSIVDADRQWFKSKQGLDAPETPRDISFCGHAILGTDIFYIPNTLEDPRFADNPLVTGPPDIRFYAGAPLRTNGGEAIGTLCIIDTKPRDFTNQELAILRDLADGVEVEIERGHLYSAHKTLESKEKRLQTLLQTIIDGVIVIDGEGIIQSVNPAVEPLFGYQENEVIGHSFSMLMPESDANKHKGFLKNYFNEGEKTIIGKRREVMGLSKDGRHFPMELTVSEMVIDGQQMFTGIVRDISLRKEHLAKLKLNDLVIQSSDDAIMTKDMESIITSWNPGAEKMFGYTANEVIGQPMLMLFPEGRENEEILIMDKIARGEKVDHFETLRKRKDGSMINISVTLSPITDDRGNIIGASKIARDITEKKKIEIMKSEFVSTVSHELRTPLTSIKGAIGLLEAKFSDLLPAKAQKILALANRNSDRLTLLINDILDLEKIESGRMEFSFTAVDLVAICKRAVEENQSFADEYQVKLCFVGSVTEAKIMADEHRLLQVFANLISNAVKYSPKGDEVTLSIEQNDNGLRVTVSDKGAGIPEAFRSRMFQRFAQADSSDTREKGGTGLGLSISKAIIDRHNGVLSYDSIVGQGTDFYFELAEQDMVQESKEHRADNRRVLICEDNLDVANILAEMVGSDIGSCDIATTGAAALSLLAKHNYCLLLLDLTLPDMSGLALLDEIKASFATADLPIIIVSGQADESKAVFTGDAVAIVDWLQKPIERTRLERALQEVLSRNRQAKILHVEDDKDIVQLTSALLEDEGKLYTTDSLAGARDMLNKEHFDLVILDIGLTDGSGLDLLDDIKQKYPVVIFSAQEIDSETAKTVTASLTKSITSNKQLLDVIKNILER